MSTILYLADMKLDNPKKGTPLHMNYMFRQISREHNLLVCAATPPDGFGLSFIPYPPQRGLKKLFELLRIVHVYTPDYIFTATELNLLAPVILKLLTGKKIAAELQGVDFEEFYSIGKIGWLRYQYLRVKIPLLLRFYDIVFAETRKLADYYLPMSRDWTVVYNGAPIDEIPDYSAKPTGEEIVIGYMGNTRPCQGVPYIIEAASILRWRGVTVRFNLILSGAIDVVEDFLEAHGFYASIHRNVPHEEALALIGNSTVVVAPMERDIVTEYSFPSKLTEYLATGIPTIVTDIPVIQELRPELDEVAAIISTENTARDLADAIERVSRMDSETRQQLGTRARAYATRMFDWKVVGKNITAAFARFQIDT